MSARIGIDRHDNQLYTATVSDADGRRKITSLAITPVDTPVPAADDSHLAIAVPDTDVMVKLIQMRNGTGIDLQSRLLFELQQSLLERPELFAFETVQTGMADRYLGLIYRREPVDALFESLQTASFEDRRFRARAAALGRGFLDFCQVGSGELQAVVDLTYTDASVCLLYKGELAGLAHLRIPDGDFGSETWLKRLAMELKTVVSFKLATLADIGVGLPLSMLTVTGELVDSRMLQYLATYFPTGVAAPMVRPSLLPASLPSGIRPDLFLPALGLTVI